MDCLNQNFMQSVAAFFSEQSLMNLMVHLQTHENIIRRTSQVSGHKFQAHGSLFDLRLATWDGIFGTVAHGSCGTPGDA